MPGEESHMTRLQRLGLAMLVTALTATGAQAQERDFTPAREPAPRVALSALVINAFYVPVRFPITVVGAVAAGATGWLTAGNQHAADDVFGLFDGTQVVTPAIIENRERFSFGADD
jgi:glycerol uptake facilitator-like aquaporin